MRFVSSILSTSTSASGSGSGFFSSSFFSTSGLSSTYSFKTFSLAAATFEPLSFPSCFYFISISFATKSWTHFVLDFCDSLADRMSFNSDFCSLERRCFIRFTRAVLASIYYAIGFSAGTGTGNTWTIGAGGYASTIVDISGLISASFISAAGSCKLLLTRGWLCDQVKLLSVVCISLTSSMPLLCCSAGSVLIFP